MSRVPTCLTCLTYLLAFVPLLLTCHPFSTCLTCLHFLCNLRALHGFIFLHPLLTWFHFLRALRAFTFFMCLTCFTCLHFLLALLALFFNVPLFLSCLTYIYFLRAYILFMYMLIKFTQTDINLSMFIKYFHFYKTRVIFCMNTFLKGEILITFNAEDLGNEKFRDC